MLWLCKASQYALSSNARWSASQYSPLLQLMKDDHQASQRNICTSSHRLLDAGKSTTLRKRTCRLYYAYLHTLPSQKGEVMPLLYKPINLVRNRLG